MQLFIENEAPTGRSAGSGKSTEFEIELEIFSAFFFFHPLVFIVKLALSRTSLYSHKVVLFRLGHIFLA